LPRNARIQIRKFWGHNPNVPAFFPFSLFPFPFSLLPFTFYLLPFTFYLLPPRSVVQRRRTQAVKPLDDRITPREECIDLITREVL
jgi:hypothetical protein